MKMLRFDSKRSSQASTCCGTLCKDCPRVVRRLPPRRCRSRSRGMMAAGTNLVMMMMVMTMMMVTMMMTMMMMMVEIVEVEAAGTNLPVGAPPADTWGFHEYSLNGEGLLIIDLYNK